METLVRNAAWVAAGAVLAGVGAYLGVPWWLVMVGIVVAGSAWEIAEQKKHERAKAQVLAELEADIKEAKEKEEKDRRQLEEERAAQARRERILRKELRAAKGE